MSESVLLLDKGEGIATLTLNRPAVLNALSSELRAALVHAFENLRDDPDAGVVILTGAGRAFCSGMDLNENELGGSGVTAASGSDIVRAIRAFDRPIIGAINGFAITGGLELALACDVMVASTAARFADTHGRMGVMPGMGITQKLSRIIGVYRAKELSLTGNFLSAEQAEAWGLVNRVVPPDELLPTCRSIAKDMLSCVPEIMRGIKRVMDEGYATTLAEGLRIELEAERADAEKRAAEVLATRRAAVQHRGRQQSKA